MVNFTALIHPDLPMHMLDALKDALSVDLLFVRVRTKEKNPFPLLLHPDIIGTSFQGRLIYSPNFHPDVLKEMNIQGVQAIAGESVLEEVYPSDAAYNVLFTDRFLVHRLDITDGVINKICLDTGRKLLNVRQGYTRCSVLPLGGDAFITEDKGIADVLEKNGSHVLRIIKGFVNLKGFPYGFIGGASTVWKKKVFFFGKIEDHPDYGKIKAFLDEKCLEAFSLSDNILEDYGSLFFFNNERKIK